MLMTLKSIETVETAVEFVDQLLKGGFQLTKWLCNRPEV